jgi:hypothetical protein
VSESPFVRVQRFETLKSALRKASFNATCLTATMTLTEAERQELAEFADGVDWNWSRCLTRDG